MERTVYPAIFHKEEDGRYSVSFPDLEGCFSEGDTLDEAFLMAKDALALWLDGSELVVPTPIDKIHVESGERVLLVEPAENTEIVYFKKSKVPQVIENGLDDKGLTKNQVAQILGVDRSYITHIIKGERVPSVEMAKRIALLLGFDWHIFYVDNLEAV